jgi:hypothetical protein
METRDRDCIRENRLNRPCMPPHQLLAGYRAVSPILCVHRCSVTAKTNLTYSHLTLCREVWQRGPLFDFPKTFSGARSAKLPPKAAPLRH